MNETLYGVIIGEGYGLVTIDPETGDTDNFLPLDLPMNVEGLVVSDGKLYVHGAVEAPFKLMLEINTETGEVTETTEYSSAITQLALGE